MRIDDIRDLLEAGIQDWRERWEGAYRFARGPGSKSRREDCLEHIQRCEVATRMVRVLGDEELRACVIVDVNVQLEGSLDCEGSVLDLVRETKRRALQSDSLEGVSLYGSINDLLFPIPDELWNPAATTEASRS